MDTNNKTIVEAPELSKILKPEHENKWVAFSPDYKNIVSAGDTLKEAVLMVQEKDRENVVFYKVLPPNYEPAFL
ncbi:MAG: hypothetical protein A2451_11395 [Bdellovibrionales bacterium RIFOXYC2_FULL_39_8]|nr:MAG: hypothetical protein A2451_11395 [Bdellovibrionales bacterium RIFOXYC2_FULL_39_8]